jgi:hypothetical protein
MFFEIAALLVRDWSASSTRVSCPNVELMGLESWYIGLAVKIVPCELLNGWLKVLYWRNLLAQASGSG